MKKPSLIILLVLLSCQLFGQTLKTTIDNSILGQGTKGISALKLRNVFTTVADSVSSKLNKNQSYSTYAISSTSTYVATTFDAGKTIVVPFGSNVTTINTDIVGSSGLATIIENKKSVTIFSTGTNGSWAYYSQIPAFSSQIIYLDSEGAFQTKQFNYPTSGIQYATFNTETGNFETKNIEDEVGAAIPISEYTDNRYIRKTGGSMTGDIILYNSVRVGGTSSFGGNTFLGKNALVSWTSGSNNTAIGDGSLSTLTTSNYNTGIGKDALKTNIGSSNTSVGGNSMYSNTTGGFNVAIGISALTNNTTGNYNVAIGPYSGQYNTGTGNVFLGGYTATSERTRQNSMFLGNGSGSLHIFGDSLNNVGIGTTRPVSKLQVNYENVISYSSNIPNGYGNLHLLPTGTNGSSTGISFGANTGYGNYTSVVNAGIHVQSSYLYGTKMRFSTSNNLTTGALSRMIIDQSGNVGINNEAPTSKLHVTGLGVYTDNSAAILGGLTAGAFYRTSTGVLMIVY